jgi:PAP2 superfamily
MTVVAPSSASEPPRTTNEMPFRALLICGSVSIVGVAVLMRLAGLSLAASRDCLVLGVTGFVAPWPLGSLQALRSERQASAGTAFLEYIGLLGIISLLGIVAAYPIGYLSPQFCDALLMRGDEALHFNWLSWYDVVAAHRSIQLVERAFYGSVFITPLVLSAYFAYFGERVRAHLFIASYWLAVVVTLALFAFFPAKGPFAVSAHGIIPYMPKSGFDQAVIIEGLKQQKIHEVPLQALHGLVSFPSFHTAAAVLYIVTAWPIARLRWPVLMVNLLMLASIPVEGTHYLTDMIAGALVGASAYATMSFLLRRRPTSQLSPSATARLPGSSGHFR